MVTSITSIVKQHTPRAQVRVGDWSVYVTLEPDAYLDSTTSATQLAMQTHASPHVAITNGTDSYHRNQQYSVTAITTAAGAIAERYAYTAYGLPTILNASATIIAASAISNCYTYTGREWDATLSLHHFRARWMSPIAGRFLTRDPIGYPGSEWDMYEFVRGRSLGYLDPSGMLQVSGGTPNPVGPRPQPPLPATAAECAAKRTKCSELRDIWAQAGKPMVVAWFDRWLSKSGCPNPSSVDIDSVSPGATSAIAANPLFLDGLASAFGCGGCVFGQPFSGQLLPTENVIDIPGTNPLTGLNDIEYLVGSIRGVTSGCLSKTGCRRSQIGRAGGEPVYQECCTYTGTVIFSIKDSFHFPGGWRNWSFVGVNPFAEYNDACSFLETNCGYCPQPWTANGTANVSKTCCKQCL